MREVQIIVRDDLDGSADASTVYFTWQGKDYEIDLTDEHLAELTDALQPYVDAARPADKRDRPSTPSRVRPNRAVAERRAALKRIRVWAESQGVPTPPRARIPIKIHEEYNRTHPDDVIPTAMEIERGEA
jgi:hypothetical protein